MTAATRADYSDWVVHAACRDTLDDGTWHPEKQNKQSTRTAKRICNGTGKNPDGGCPVREACLEYALANGEIGGVWGGMDDHERRRLLEARQPRQAG